MKPSFEALKGSHYSSNKMSPAFVDGETFYRELGFDINQLIKENPGYVNTCATRMSLALLNSGVIFSGRLKIRAGKHKGRTVEPGAKLLADQLSQSSALGKPQLFSPKEAMAKLSGKKGVVFFWKISGYGGGHIDLIESSNSIQVCHSGCYFDAKEIWFWRLD
jgi:hypothetical protein